MKYTFLIIATLFFGLSLFSQTDNYAIEQYKKELVSYSKNIKECEEDIKCCQKMKNLYQQYKSKQLSEISSTPAGTTTTSKYTVWLIQTYSDCSYKINTMSFYMGTAEDKKHETSIYEKKYNDLIGAKESCISIRRSQIADYKGLINDTKQKMKAEINAQKRVVNEYYANKVQEANKKYDAMKNEIEYEPQVSNTNNYEYKAQSISSYNESDIETRAIGYTNPEQYEKVYDEEIEVHNYNMDAGSDYEEFEMENSEIPQMIKYENQKVEEDFVVESVKSVEGSNEMEEKSQFENNTYNNMNDLGRMLENIEIAEEDDAEEIETDTKLNKHEYKKPNIESASSNGYMDRMSNYWENNVVEPATKKTEDIVKAVEDMSGYDVVEKSKKYIKSKAKKVVEKVSGYEQITNNIKSNLPTVSKVNRLVNKVTGVTEFMGELKDAFYKEDFSDPQYFKKVTQNAKKVMNDRYPGLGTYLLD